MCSDVSIFYAKTYLCSGFQTYSHTRGLKSFHSTSDFASESDEVKSPKTT